MRILIDRYVPFLSGVLEPFAEVCYLEPEEFTRVAVSEAEVLIIRTRTRCDAELLEGSKVRMICTATIGTDHIDSEYCSEKGIRVVSCPGCNADGVCDYVLEALSYLEEQGLRRSGRRIGIIGVGHVGARVAEKAAERGYTVLLNDPPKHLGIELARLLHEADIITIHTPLTKGGDYPTYHLLGEEAIGQCKRGVSIINAARGGVVAEKALLAALSSGQAGHAVIDTWEDEPKINAELLQAVDLASFHIAGYTRQGKQNASQMVLDAIVEEYQLPPLHCLQEAEPVRPVAEKWLCSISEQLKAQPEDFEKLRREYQLR